jgi:hypothetical protein
LIIEGAELSTNWGHVVALGAERIPTADELQGDPIAAVQASKGLVALAHPVQDRNGWTGERQLAERANFFELYSGDSMLRRAFDAPFTVLLSAAGAYLSNPRHAMTLLTRNDPEDVPRLFQLSTHAPMVTLCAHDAHGVPTYREMFDQMALSLPLGDRASIPDDPNEAAAWVLRGLAEGQAYCVFRSFGDGAGFQVAPWTPARRVKIGTTLEVTLPPGTTPADTQVRCHGGCEVQADGRSVLLRTKGPVHLEVWRLAPGRIFGAEWRPWLIPSPVLVDD